jgi:hypothetical protein
LSGRHSQFGGSLVLIIGLPGTAVPGQPAQQKTHYPQNHLLFLRAVLSTGCGEKGWLKVAIPFP